MRYELKPLGVGGTLDQAIRIFKDRFALFLVILLILRIPGTAIIQYYVFTNMGQLPAQPTDAQVNEFFSRLGRLYVYVLAPSILADMLLITPFTSAALIYAAARVYLVQQPGVIHFAPVVLGMETAQRVEIRSGLQEGDLVIVGRHAGLKDGDKVQPKMSGTQAK